MLGRIVLNNFVTGSRRRYHLIGLLQCTRKHSISSYYSRILEPTRARIPELSKLLYSTKSDPAGDKSLADNDIHNASNSVIELDKFDKDRLSSFLQNNEIVESIREYLNECVFTNMTDYGFRVLMSYRERNMRIKTNVNLNNIDLFHPLMNSYANQGNFEKLSEIHEILKQSKINRTPQTFAYLLQCVGRLPQTDENTNAIKQIINEAESDGFSLDDIMYKSVFVLDQREVVLKAIHRINENFQPTYTAPNLYYTNPMLQHLNSKSEGQMDKEKSMTRAQQFTTAELHSFAEQQLEAEMITNVPMSKISLQTFLQTTPFTAFCSKTLGQLYTQWRSDFIVKFNKDLEWQRRKMETSQTHEINRLPSLTLLEPEEYADLVIEHFQYLLQRDGAFPLTIAFVHFNLGHKVALKFEDKLKKAYGLIDQKQELYKKYCEQLSSENSTDNPRQIWQRLEIETQGQIHNKPEFWWTRKKKAVVGRSLYEIFLRRTFIDCNILRQKSKPKYKPVIKHMISKRDGVKYYHLNETLVLLHQEAQPGYKIMADDLPMLCPPVPWTSEDNGGFLITDLDLIRSDYSTEQANTIKKWPQTEIYPMLDALNHISNYPWTINNHVLDIIIEAYVKMFEEDLRRFSSPRGGPNGPSARLGQIFAKMKRSRGEIFYKLLVGNHFRNKPIWFAHSVDYRGRLYPTPPILSYTAGDINRSLLLLNEKKPLGNDGLEWLKLYCVNLTGKKKRDSLAERLEYANESMDDILDSADNPLTGRMWWADSEEPWQTLACCIEIANAIRSNDPSQYLSGFPVQVDGTCNSLQHYAALNRDKDLAVSVNLTLTEKPNDAYSMFAEVLEEHRANEAQNDSSVAKALEGYITRANVKRMITALVYGAGHERVRATIEKTLRAFPEFPRDMSEEASKFLAEKSILVYSEKFKSANKIKKWLNRCAKHISSDLDKPIEWVTPLGWPVVQPKSLDEENQKTSVFGTNHFTTSGHGAIAPNFIHSLEACHMVLVSLACEKAGVTFISEHDAFGTHACSISRLNDLNREQFLLLYTQPILKDLAMFFRKKHPKHESEGAITSIAENSENQEKQGDFADIFEQVPEEGDFDLNEVLKSKYFFS